VLEPTDEQQLLGGRPVAQSIPASRVAAAAAGARRLVVLDDDPTGTQTVADIPVVTAWEPDDLRWALRQGTYGFYVLTNTRSLDATAAAERNREVMTALASVAEEEAVEVAVVSRSDSTLRGHFPLETDVIADQLEAHGQAVQGVALIPAYIDAGRITVDSIHWVRSDGRMVPASQTEFAKDPEFGYESSALQDYVAEKTGGRWHSDDVMRITLDQLRSGTIESIAVRLGELRDRRPVVVDAATDEDLRVFALAAIEVERQGTTLLYRTGPSFVRNRLGQDIHAPLSDAALRELLATDSSEGNEHTPGKAGLVVVGSYVGLTSRQLEALSAMDGLRRVTLDVASLLSAGDDDLLIEQLAGAVADALAGGDVVLATSRTRIAGLDERSSRHIQAKVSSALVEVVREAVSQRRPRWIVAKGGITSSDVATGALGIRRAWVRGTLLPGIVSLWQPENPGAQSIPYAVFAGNVGEAGSLAKVVTRLREAS
jgi:uncharacterized protein YgbK (DUF1537 family)